MNLTPLQLQILELLAGGASQHTIGQTLSLTRGQVGLHIAVLYQLLGADNAPHAVYIAMKKGLIQ